MIQYQCACASPQHCNASVPPSQPAPPLHGPCATSPAHSPSRWISLPATLSATSDLLAATPRASSSAPARTGRGILISRCDCCVSVCLPTLRPGHLLDESFTEWAATLYKAGRAADRHRSASRKSHTRLEARNHVAWRRGMTSRCTVSNLGGRELCTAFPPPYHAEPFFTFMLNHESPLRIVLCHTHLCPQAHCRPR